MGHGGGGVAGATRRYLKATTSWMEACLEAEIVGYNREAAPLEIDRSEHTQRVSLWQLFHADQHKPIVAGHLIGYIAPLQTWCRKNREQ